MKNTLVISAGLALLTVMVYARVLGNDFINLDDAHYVGTNYYVKQGVTLEGIQWAFVTNRAANWHPLTWISLMLDQQIFGLKPWGYHLTNLLLHTANTVLLFLVFAKMSNAPWKSAFVAAVFAVHPGHVESVAWVAERKDVLSTFFGFLTLWSYVRHAKSPGAVNYWLTVAFFILSLLSKQMLVTLPFLLLLLDFWPLGRLRFASQGENAADETSPGRFPQTSLSELLWEKVPLLAQSAVFAAVTVLAQRTGGSVTNLEMYPMHVRIANAFVAYLKYMTMTFWPTGFGVYYPHPGNNVSMGLAALAAGILALVTLLAVVSWKSRPYLIVGWFWYLGTLVPVIGLVQVGMQGMADRYLYIPMIGLSIMVAWGIPSLVPEMPGKRETMGLLAGLSVAALSVLCWIQVGYWKTSGTLFEHTLAVAGPSPIGHSSLGQYYFSKQELDKAIEQFQKAIEINPLVVLPKMNLGLAMSLKGNQEEALKHVMEAAKLAPNNPEVQHSLGVVLAAIGRYEDSIAAQSKAVEIYPEYSAAHNDLGILYSKNDKLDEAIKHLSLAVRYDPQAAFVRVNLAEALLKQGKAQEALQLAASAQQLRPDYPESYIAIANALTALRRFDSIGPVLQQAQRLAGNDPRLRKLVIQSISDFSRAVAELNQQTGKLDDAIANYRDGIQIDPENPKLHNSLGTAYAMKGNLAEAIQEFLQAAKLDPKFAEAKQNLGKAYLSQGKTQEAIAEFRSAIVLAPTWPAPKNDLAWVLATNPSPEIRNGKEAVELAEQVSKEVGGEAPDFLDTLAAAYAETGQFDKAVASAEKAVELALAAGQSTHAEELQKRRDQYKAGQPYHAESTAPTPPEAAPPIPPAAETEKVADPLIPGLIADPIAQPPLPDPAAPVVPPVPTP